MFRVERINKMTIRIFRLTGLVAVGLVAAGLGSAADLQSMTGIARRDVYRDSQTTTTGIAVSVSVPTSQAVPLEGQNLRQSDTALAEQLRAGLRADLHAGLRSDVRAAVRADLHAGLRNGVRAAVRADLHAGLRNDVRAAVRADLHADLRSDVRAAVRADLHAGLRNQ
jgi:hypothetical protein